MIIYDSVIVCSIVCNSVHYYGSNGTLGPTSNKISKSIFDQLTSISSVADVTGLYYVSCVLIVHLLFMHILHAMQVCCTYMYSIFPIYM